jgi:hypothetical protein
MSVEGFKSPEAKEIQKKAEAAKEVSWPLSEEDLGLLNIKLEVEKRTLMDVAYLQLQLTEVVRRAEAIRKDREEACVKLEEKLGIPKGTAWILDYEKKALVKRA